MNKQVKEVKKSNKPYHVRGKMGGVPVLLDKCKTSAEAEKSLVVFASKKFYNELHVKNIDEVEKVELESEM